MGTIGLIYFFILFTIPVTMVVFMAVAYGLDFWEWKRALEPRYMKAAPIAYFLLFTLMFHNNAMLSAFELYLFYQLSLGVASIACIFLKEKVMYGVYLFPGGVILAMLIVLIIA